MVNVNFLGSGNISNDDINMKGKVCLLGDNAVGKTSLIRRYVLNVFEDKYITTIGTNITKKSIKLRNPKDNKQINISLLIWDIMGDLANLEESIHSYNKYSPQSKYFQNARGGIVVCDITRPNTLSSITKWVDSLKETAGDVPLIFIGNKYDLKPIARVTTGDLQDIAGQFNSRYLFTSAKDGHNVDMAFSKVAKLMAKSYLKSIS